LKDLRFALPAILSLSLLAVILLMAPYAFPMRGQSVYQWPDARVTVLEVLSIFAILFFAGTLKKPGVLKLTSAACFGFAGVNFVLFIVFNYGTNAPDGTLQQLFSAQAAMNAMNLMDGLRLSPVYGLAVQTIAWFLAMSVSFFAFRFGKGTRPAALDALQFMSLTLALYALGVCVLIPQWSARMIVDMQNSTVLSWFTNDDLLIVATTAFLVSMALRLTIGRSRQPALPKVTASAVANP